MRLTVKCLRPARKGPPAVQIARAQEVEAGRTVDAEVSGGSADKATEEKLVRSLRSHERIVGGIVMGILRWSA